MNVRFTRHAEVKLLQRRIPKDLVLNTLTAPDFVIPSYGNRERAYKKFGKNYLEVVFIREGFSYVVITQHWVAKSKKIR